MKQKKERRERKGVTSVKLFNISKVCLWCVLYTKYCLLYVVTNTHPGGCNACKQGVVTPLKIFLPPKFFFLNFCFKCFVLLKPKNVKKLHKPQNVYLFYTSKR